MKKNSKNGPAPSGFLLILAVFLLTGCFAKRSFSSRSVSGESLVFVGNEPVALAFLPINEKPISLRSHYVNSPSNIVYVEGWDFIVDYETGEIRRTEISRIPDFRSNQLYGVENFDHSKFPGFGNGGFFAFADYTAKQKLDWPKQPVQTEYLPRTRKKLEQGGHVKLVAFGDSITAGGDATEPALIFWERWAAALQQKYPKAKIKAINGATGGDRTTEGLIRLNEKVITQKPDLVLIGFGMNDHNIGGFGTTLETFTNNLVVMIDRIRQETSAEILLFSTFPPNAKWKFGSRNMAAYADATEEVARRKNCAFADIYRNWNAIADRKKPEDLLGNNINHPNDFGHWIYFEVLKHSGL